MANNVPFVLVILDGLADNPNPKANAVAMAKKPTLDSLASCPRTELVTWGPRVGLPEGQMGNSEVGHLNLGGGRIVQQELTRIDEAVSTRALTKVPALGTLFEQVKSNPMAALHLIGLTSTGGVHSSVEHLLALIAAALESGVSRVYIHAITDGRDRPTDASLQDVQHLCDFLKKDCARFKASAEFGVATMVGRYFAMDRDKRWERTGKAMRLYTQGEGEPFLDPMEALRKRIAAGETDEFHEPLAAAPGTFKRASTIQPGDGVLFFNFRADRMRQIVSAFLPPELGGRPADSDTASLRPAGLNIVTLSEYDASYKVPVLFPPTFVKNHLGEVLSAAGLTQLRAAETEKYAHVTYFFNGAVEAPYAGEERLLVPSPRDVATYDLKPQMSANELTDAVIATIKEKSPDVIILNYANCDMVGHTGVLEAAVAAVETVDRCLGRILATIDSLGGTAIVTADHGNADQMVNYETGAPHTFHTMYPVPLYLVGKPFAGRTLRPGGALCDVAPTICDILGLSKPAEMTGISLLVPDA